MNVPFNHIHKENSLVSPTAPQEETLLQQDLSEGGRAGSTGRADTQVHTPTFALKCFCLPAKAMLRAGSWRGRTHIGRDSAAPGWEQDWQRWTSQGAHPEKGSLQHPPPCKLPSLSLSFCSFNWKKKKKLFSDSWLDLLKSCHFCTV